LTEDDVSSPKMNGRVGTAPFDSLAPEE
jgi:hypothetical protein